MTDKSPHPPKFRTPLWSHVTEGAKAHELRLQHCADCGQVQYPPREICGNCLSDALEWRKTSGAGEVLSATRLEISIDPWFQKRLPVDVALVKLDAGPVCYVFAADALNSGDRAIVDARVNEADEAVLWASLAGKP
jgi:uncharacterized OB-fold protein